MTVTPQPPYTGRVHLYNIRTKLLKQRRFRQALGLSLLIALFIGLIIVPVESMAPGARIKTPSDGLWWAVQTLTTVGYGDVVPVTPIGRLLGVLLLIVGAVLFGTVVAMISSSMSRSQEEYYWSRMFQRMDELEKKMAELQKQETFLLMKDQKVPTPKPPEHTK